MVGEDDRCRGAQLVMIGGSVHVLEVSAGTRLGRSRSESREVFHALGCDDQGALLEVIT